MRARVILASTFSAWFMATAAIPDEIDRPAWDRGEPYGPPTLLQALETAINKDRVSAGLPAEEASPEPSWGLRAAEVCNALSRSPSALDRCLDTLANGPKP